MQNAELDETRAGINIARRNINNFRYADDTTLNGRKWRGTKESLNDGERGEWKGWLKTQHSKNLIMTSGPITSWQIDGETMERLRDVIFLGSKITAGGDCSHAIRDACSLEKSYDRSIDSVLKSRNITLQTKVCLVKAMVFPVIMYRCESSTTKKVNAEELWFLICGVGEESPLDCKESKPILQEISPEYSGCWNWSSNALATWCEEPTYWERPWCWEGLKAGGEGADRGQEVGWHHWLDGHEFEQAQEMVKNREIWRAAIHRRSQTRLSNWTTTKLVWPLWNTLWKVPQKIKNKTTI